MANQNQDDGYIEGTGQSPQQQPVSEAVRSMDTSGDDNIILGDTMSNMLDRIDAEDDLQRIKAGCALINTFNYAIQVQAKRTQWQPSDYHRFVRALLVLDSIGREAIATRQASSLEASVKEAFAGRNQVEQPQRPLPQVQPVRPTKTDPLSSLPRPRGNAIMQDGVVVDDRRMPMR